MRGISKLKPIFLRQIKFYRYNGINFAYNLFIAIPRDLCNLLELTVYEIICTRNFIQFGRVASECIQY